MGTSQWRLARVAKIESRIYASLTYEYREKDLERLQLVLKQRAHLERSFRIAIADLKQLQNEGPEGNPAFGSPIAPDCRYPASPRRLPRATLFNSNPLGFDRPNGTAKPRPPAPGPCAPNAPTRRSQPPPGRSIMGEGRKSSKERANYP